MPISKLVCPHCGHDGTPETSRPPLGSYGFNYLAEGLVCREVKGFDETGGCCFRGILNARALREAAPSLSAAFAGELFRRPKG